MGYAGSSLKPHSATVSRMPAPLLAALIFTGGFFSVIAVKVGIAKLPDGVNWPVLFGGGCLAGIGFTMSLFVAGLAFPEDLHHELLTDAKIGVFTGSVLSALAGVVLLLLTLRKKSV